ncbi:MAG TPA: AIR synthase-related protein, partial [Crinalium sp.]
GDVLLTPTQIYVQPILGALKQELPIHGMAHITGGGLPENLPRCLGPGQAVKVDPTAWAVLPIFDWLAAEGDVSPKAMFHTFNMGIGFVVLVPADAVATTMQYFADQNLAAYAIGEVVSGSGVVGLPE